MIAKCKLLLLVSFFISNILSGQHIDEGYFHDWVYGAHGVYGNFKLTSTKDRTCFKIEKADAQSAVIRHLNPSGVVTNTTTVRFADGALCKIEEANQWGDIYDRVSLAKLGEDSFRVTDLSQGKNAYLPNKYHVWIFDHELMTEERYYSYRGELSDGTGGYAIIRYKNYDDPVRLGLTKETTYFDAQNNPVLSKPGQYHGWKAEYDDHANKTHQIYFGLQGEPKTVNGKSNAGFKVTFDADNNEIRDMFLDTGGHVTPNSNGVAIIDYEYVHGYKLKETRFDSSGQPVKALSSGDGAAIVKYDYDKDGNRVRQKYFDETGKPINNFSDVQEIASFFSDANMQTRVSYFDAFGKPSVDKDGINTTIYVRDDRNRIIQESNYGVDGQPIKTKAEKVFMLKRKYDEYGREISISYWADSNTRMPTWNGSYETTTKYNEDGQPVEYATLDSDGYPFIAEDGSSVEKLIYNSDGRLGERQFLHNNKLVDRKRGVTCQYSTIRYGHDEKGRVNELTFWGSDQRPVNARVWMVDSVAAHRIVFIYRGNRIIEQDLYKIDESDPYQVIDCLKSDYISGSGIGIGRKNAN